MSDKHQPFDPEKIAIVEVKIVKGQVDIPEAFDQKQVGGYHLDRNLQLAFNLEEKLAKADFSIEIKTESNGRNPEEATGFFHLVFIYQVENLEALAKSGKNNLIELHPDLGNALASMTYSTARGVLLTRLQGTALQNFVLPVINPNKLLHHKT